MKSIHYGLQEPVYATMTSSLSILSKASTSKIQTVGLGLGLGLVLFTTLIVLLQYNVWRDGSPLEEECLSKYTRILMPLSNDQ